MNTRKNGTSLAGRIARLALRGTARTRRLLAVALAMAWSLPAAAGEAAFEEPLYPGVAYYRLRPGLTGFWQIRDRNRTTFAGRAAYDTRYAERMSFVTDLRVLAATVRVVLRGTGY